MPRLAVEIKLKVIGLHREGFRVLQVCLFNTKIFTTLNSDSISIHRLNTNKARYASANTYLMTHVFNYHETNISMDIICGLHGTIGTFLQFIPIN